MGPHLNRAPDEVQTFSVQTISTDGNIWVGELDLSHARLYSIPAVQIPIEHDYHLHALVDTGAAYFIIGSTVFKALTEHWSDKKLRDRTTSIRRKIVSVTGDAVGSVGTYTFLITVGRKVRSHQLTVMDDSHPNSPLRKMFDAIIGMDLWTSTGAVLDFAARKVVIDGQEIPMQFNHKLQIAENSPLPALFANSVAEAPRDPEDVLVQAMCGKNLSKVPQIRRGRRPVTVSIRPIKTVTVPAGRVRIIKCRPKRMQQGNDQWVFCYHILHQQIEDMPLYVLPTRWDRMHHDEVHLAFHNTGNKDIQVTPSDALTIIADISATNDPAVSNLVAKGSPDDYDKEWNRLAEATVDAA